jgi:hypothetical protein
MAVTVEKLSVSLNVENAAWLRERSEESEVSVSALVDEAVGAKRRHEALEKLLKELGQDEPLNDAMGSFIRAEMRGSDADVVHIGDDGVAPTTNTTPQLMKSSGTTPRSDSLRAQLRSWSPKR